MWNTKASAIPRNERNAISLVNVHRVLVIDGIAIRTNLTEEDLQNPKLWTLRSPSAWARWIRLAYGEAAASGAKKQEPAERGDSSDTEGQGDQRSAPVE